MNFKQFKFILVIVLIFTFMSTSFKVSAENSAQTKLSKIEMDTFGELQKGSLLDRIAYLEQIYNGKKLSGNTNTRLEDIYDRLYGNKSEIGLLTKLNALEWNINNEVKDLSIYKRLAKLEEEFLGGTLNGTVTKKIQVLCQNFYGKNSLPLVKIQIPANTLIKVETLEPIDSKSLKVGESIPIRVVENVFVDNRVVFAKGLHGDGIVSSVRRAKNIMNNGKIEIDFQTLRTLDGQDAKIFVDFIAKEKMKAESMAKGLSLIGMTFSGKYGGIEEIFVRGKNISLPAGVELYVQLKDPITVYGIGDVSQNSPQNPSEQEKVIKIFQ